MPEEAEPQPWHSLYWRAWEALRFDRQFGAMGGELPIPYTAISQYARDNEITGNDFRVFHALMSVLDSEWLAHQAKKTEKPG